MILKNHKIYLVLSFILFSIIFVSCHAGGSQFSDGNPAGFFAGLWHGIISVITFIISLFSDSVKIYEINNVGTLYDLGFLLGVICIWGGSGGIGVRKVGGKRKKYKEWDEVGENIKTEIFQELKEWSETEPDENWEEIGEKVGKKLKEIIRKWMEKE